MPNIISSQEAEGRQALLTEIFLDYFLMTKSIHRWALSSDWREDGGTVKVKQLALLKRRPGTSFGSYIYFFKLPPAWHRHSNLEELISGRDGSHDFSDPHLIKSPYQNTGSWEEEPVGNSRQAGRQKKKKKKILPASSFTGQIKTTAEQVIKQEIMNSIILFSV